MRLFKSKSILKTWCISYALMLITVILTNIYIMNTTGNKLMTELDTANRYFMKNINISIDSTFSEIDTVKAEITGLSEVNEFASAVYSDSERRFAAAKITEKINSILANHSGIADCTLYYPNSDIIITSSMFARSEAYYNMLSAGGEQTYEQWHSYLMPRTRTYDACRIKSSRGDIVNTVAVTMPVPSSRGNTVYGIRIYADKSYMFRTIDADEAIVVLNSSDNQLFSSNDETYDFNNIWLKDKNMYRTHVCDIGGKKAYISYTSSYKYSYKYVHITDKNDFSQKNMQIILICVISNLLCVIIVLAIMYVTSRWNYRGIRSILGNGDEEPLDGNEYEIIKNKIDASLKMNNALQEKLDDQMAIVKDGFLANYIKGYVEYKDIVEYMGMYDNISEDSHFFVVSFNISDYGVLKDDPKRYGIFSVNNIIGDLFEEENYIYIETDRTSVYIISCEDDDIASELKYIEIFEKASELAYNILQIRINGGISNAEKGFDSVPALYKQASKALESAMFYDADKFVEYADINESTHVFSNEKRIELILAVKERNKEKAYELTDEIFSANDGYIFNAKPGYMGAAYNIINEIIAYAKQNLPDAYEKMFLTVKDINDAGTLRDIKGTIISAVDAVCADAPTTDEKPNEIYIHTDGYVREHFTEPNLNVSAIGEHLNMSAFYVSKIFKQYSGVKLTNFIHDLRIDLAKKMLVENPDAKVNDIANAVGYDNPRNFLKIFKEKTGMAPTQYRKLNS